MIHTKPLYNIDDNAMYYTSLSIIGYFRRPKKLVSSPFKQIIHRRHEGKYVRDNWKLVPVSLNVKGDKRCRSISNIGR